MTDETLAAPAPEAGEAVSSEAPAEKTEDQLLSEAYDRMQGEEEAPQEEATKEDAQPEEPEEKTEAEEGEDAEAEAEDPEDDEGEQPGDVDLPLDLPRALKEKWGEIPEETRDVITSAHREMSNKVAMFGKEAAAFRPIKESLVKAIEANPEIANMKPEEVASELPALVRAGQELKSDPFNGILKLAQAHGITDHLSQYFSGGQADTRVAQENDALRKEIQELKRYASPDFMEQKFEEFSTRKEAMSSVQEFAEKAEHWGDVEQHLPVFIEAAKQIMGDEAPARDVLESAYNMAVSQLKPEKAKAKGAAPSATPEPDPAKVQKAREAKSVNIAGKPTGKPRPQSEDEIMEAVWQKHQRAS